MDLALPPSDHPNSVTAVAVQLVGLDVARVLIVSPEADASAAGTLELVRALADRQMQVLLIDMSGSGIVGHAMLDGKPMAGVTELLLGQKRFTEVIHSDHYSQAHVMPLGEADPEQAMRSVDRLLTILDALEAAYDLVVVECGPSSAAHIQRLVSDKVQIILNIVDPEANIVALAARDLDQAGFSDVIIMISEQTPPASAAET